ncbi:MAG: class I SAM-dependent methyltransferase [Pirellulales bacterium]
MRTTMPLLFCLTMMFGLVFQAGSTSAEPNADESADKKEKPKLPPALTHYLGRRVAQTMHYTGAPWLVRESREREEECSALIKQLKLKPGQVVCDLGCGNGFYAVKMAELVAAKGEVLCVDIQPEMLVLLRERAKVAKLKNITPILGTLINPNLPAGKVDMILCVDVYHEFSHPVHMLRELRAALAPKGQIVLAEFRAEDRTVPIKPLHKMSKKQVLKELNANGFKLARQFDGLPWQHLMFFAKDDDWQPPKD